MGEKRKARLSTNERSSKKEKKSNTSVVSSASNEEIDEQASMHSHSSTSDSSSGQEQENPIVQDVEESQTITPIDVETVAEEIQVQIDPISVDEGSQLPMTNETSSTNKSWWSSLARLFHFGYSNNESKALMNATADLPSTSSMNSSYLGNVKSRRALHGDSLVG